MDWIKSQPGQHTIPCFICQRKDQASTPTATKIHQRKFEEEKKNTRGIGYFPTISQIEINTKNH